MLHPQGRPPFEADVVSADEVASRTELTQEVAERVATALANLSLRENPRVQPIREVLTGLYNRRFLEEAIGNRGAACTTRRLGGRYRHARHRLLQAV